jgi:drug/metabolite transporter (DMT)-like permease
VSFVALGLLAGLMWGASDFLGGFATRRAAVAAVVVVSQLAGVAAILTILASTGQPLPGTRPFLLAMAGGVAAGIGLVAFYRALAAGVMGVVAPVAATGVLIPVAVGVAGGERPGLAAAAGGVVVIAGILMAARGTGARGTGGIGMALLAASGFGTFYVFLDLAAEGGALWTVLGARTASIPLVAVAALAMGMSLRPPRAALMVIAAAGILDALAVLTFTSASSRGPLSIVAVLGSTYPIVTAAIAAAVVRERLTRLQWAGSVIAMAGVLIIAANR